MPNVIQNRRVVLANPPRTAAPAFVGPLDTLTAQGAAFARAYSVQRLLTAWAGGVGTITSDAGGNPSADVGFLADGAMDVATANALAGNKFWTTWKDQSGTQDAAQATLANAPYFSSDLFTGGALGSSSSTGSRGMTVGAVDFSAGKFAWLVIRQGSTVMAPGSSNLLSGYSGSTLRFIQAGTNVSMNFGSSPTTTRTAASGMSANNFYSVGARGTASGAVLTVDDVALYSGTSTAINWTAAYLGSLANASHAGSFFNAGALILECIIFNANPRGLAGWADFVANRHAYFGS